MTKTGRRLPPFAKAYATPRRAEPCLREKFVNSFPVARRLVCTQCAHGPRPHPGTNASHAPASTRTCVRASLRQAHAASEVLHPPPTQKVIYRRDAEGAEKEIEALRCAQDDDARRIAKSGCATMKRARHAVPLRKQRQEREADD